MHITVLYDRDSQTPVARSPRWLNFVTVTTNNSGSTQSPFWLGEFCGGFHISGINIVWTPDLLCDNKQFRIQALTFRRTDCFYLQDREFSASYFYFHQYFTACYYIYFTPFCLHSTKNTPERLAQVKCPTSPIFKETRNFFPDGKPTEAWTWPPTPSHLMPTFRTPGANPPLPNITSRYAPVNCIFVLSPSPPPPAHQQTPISILDVLLIVYHYVSQ
jgi:hypothetical protein